MLTNAVRALAAALVLTGCTVHEAGSPVPDPAMSEPITATQALGDLATFDACDLVSAPDLLPLGTPVKTTPNALDNCTFTLDEDGLIEIGHLTMVTPEQLTEWKPIQLPKRLDLATYLAGDDKCGVVLRFVGGEAIQVAVSFTKAREGKACVVATATARMIAARISQGKPVGRAHQEHGSLRAIDPCTLITPDMIAAVPVTGAPRSGTARHDCRVGGTDGPRLTVSFTADKSVVVRPDNPIRSTIAGRISLTQSRDGKCFVLTEHVSLGRAVLPNGHEQARVEVVAPGDACASAKAVAGLLWPKLPSR
ncbi:hypothetical protein SAMN05192558_103496 [Actinokineospora alba]|uniref:DUF3558 domain-containing protein n=1 Tax=Actinokineospora alba TaxID=504798 RepID=A0A1H0KI18_9PSEU|nr:hypothetical protein [Actinokineospora alba]TDP67891.1 hypothetical protein C8E96_3447 [Actinokineospora alba]SDH88288.1 hypothetical protein SAMN05421871_102553 [Actinokineospora alba]SDO55624.1 hypothetical protein SAMN05192558_103496 [Actinokineospora alba]